MSDASPDTVSATAQSTKATTYSENQCLSRDAESALALCLKAVAPGADEAHCCETLEVLEALLPALASSDIDALISAPGYCAIRTPLLRIRAGTWFTHECDLARRALEHDASSALGNLFADHIPLQAYADELAVLKSLSPRKILILGSGACPMSAVVFQDAFPRATIMGLDRSREACDLSARLLAQSGYSAVKIQHGEAQNPLAIGEYDCVIMALTVGGDEAEKRRIISELKTHADPDTILVARTAVAWGRILYPMIDLPEIAAKAALQCVGSTQQRSVAVPIRMGELQV